MSADREARLTPILGMARRHRATVLASVRCGCFQCGAFFPPSDIREWESAGGTARCPRCGLAGVLPETPAVALSTPLLAEMRAYYFEAAQRPEWWQRSLSARQTVVLVWLAGWIASAAMMAIGDYRLRHRPPSLADVAMYVGIGAVMGPFFGLLAAWKAGMFSRKRNKPGDPA